MRAFNFSAGPAMLPEAVMRKAQAEFLNWNNTGMSVMEMSHRSKEFMEVAHHMEAPYVKSWAFLAIIRCCSCMAAPLCSLPVCR